MRKSYFNELLLAFAVFSLLACGKSEKIEDNGTARTEELKQALEKINGIDPQYDDVREIITQYSSASKILSKKVQSGQATAEEKYVFAVADTFLLLHQLINFLNSLIPVVIQGSVTQQDLSKIINSIPTASPPKITGSSQIFIKEESSVTQLPYGCSGIQGLAQFLCSSLDSALLSRLENDIRYLREVQADAESSGKDFRVKIERLPLKIQFSVLQYTLDFGGEHDLGTAYFFESLLDVVDAFFRLIFSVNIDLLGGIFDIPNYLKNVSLTSDPILHAGRIFSYLLINNPLAFTVSSTLEVERTRYQLVQSIDKLVKFIDYVKKNNVDTEDDIIFFNSEKKYFMLRYKYNGQVREREILRENSVENLKRIVQKLKNNINGDSNSMLSTNDVVFIGAVALVSVVKSGIFDVFVNFLLTVAQQGGGGNQSGQLGQINQLINSDLFQPETVAGLISSLFGNIFYFDLGTLFSNLIEGQAKYREFLPAWTTNLPSFKNNFVFEWDCGARLYSDDITDTSKYKRELFGLSCTSPQSDISPFSFSNDITISISLEGVQGWGNPANFQIPQDEIFFKFPYILFQDPTFGGLIKIRGAGIIGKAGGDNQGKIRTFLQSCGVSVDDSKADYRGDRRKGNCALNASLQLIIDGLMGLISGQNQSISGQNQS